MAGLLCAVLVGGAHAQAESSPRGSAVLGSTLLNAEDRDRLLRDQALQAGAAEHIDLQPLANPHLDAATREAEALLRSLRETDPSLRAARQQAQQRATYTRHSTLLFVSLSLHAAGLKDLFALASQRQDVVLVFRGIPEGMKLDQGMAHYQALVSGYDPLPNLVIDPGLFRDFQVDVVPTLVALGGDGERLPDTREVARVAGLSALHWLEQRIAQGERGDQGQRGPVAAIAERDLIEMMQARVAAIDWEARKTAAIERFWQGRVFIDLPPAPQARTRTIDPRVVVTEALRDAQGAVLVEAGTVLNPLDQVPFTQALIIFDPLAPGQLGTLEARLPQLAGQAGIQRLTYLATRMDREAGWEGYTQLSNRFEAPIYLVTPEIVERFELEHTPSIVTSDGQRFVVRELAAQVGGAP